MQRTVIKVNKLDLNWPERCPYCGRDLRGAGDIVGFSLKVKRGLKGLLTEGLASKKLLIKLCGPCAKRVSMFKTMETIASIMIFVAIIGPVLLKIQSMQRIIYVAGGVFWLGLMLIGVAEMGALKTIGAECRFLSPSKWALKFHNTLFSDEFSSLNSRLIEGM